MDPHATDAAIGRPVRGDQGDGTWGAPRGRPRCRACDRGRGGLPLPLLLFFSMFSVVERAATAAAWTY
jgi:hypothetical protein